MYKRILIPLDGSEAAEAILPHLDVLARAGGAELILVRVAVNPAAEFAMSDPAIAGQVVESLEASSKDYMSGVGERLASQGYKVSTQVVEGPVAESILRLAEHEKADLIAMSTHGRSGIARWLIGSVADKVVRGSHLPVLLVRPAVPGAA